MLAQALDDPGLGGWIIGLIIGAVVVVIVVVVVGLIIAAASRIDRLAGRAVAALETAHGHTRPLWEVSRTNRLLETVTRQARAARGQLEER